MARSFFGGVHPKAYKELSCEAEITAFQPKLVSIAMSQHIGAPCKPLVKVGDRVLLGQKIGDGQGLCAPVHASVSGIVKQVALRPHPGGSEQMAVVIENDFQDSPCPEIQPRQSIEGLGPQELTQIIREAGITGMGGAGFPTHVKLSSGLGKVDTVIVNGAECEPYITSDDRLMRESPERIIGGLEIICRILQPKTVAIGIENNKPQAIESMTRAAKAPVQVLALRVRYPQGAEKQLIQAVTGRQVPPGGLPAQVGCAVFNAATCAAIYDAVWLGLPLLRRAVTVTGKAICKPGNFLAPIGTLYSDLIEAAGGFKAAPYKVLCGGPMMGFTQHSLDVGTIKGNNALTCLLPEDGREVPSPHCIRCGRCVRACPMHLMPLRMYRAQQKCDLEALEKLHMMDCIECGSCAYGCPAGIELVQSFRTGKKLLRDAAAKQKAKEAAAK